MFHQTSVYLSCISILFNSIKCFSCLLQPSSFCNCSYLMMTETDSRNMQRNSIQINTLYLCSCNVRKGKRTLAQCTSNCNKLITQSKMYKTIVNTKICVKHLAPARTAFFRPGCSEVVLLFDSVILRRSYLNYIIVLYSAFRITRILPLVL